MAAAVQEGWGEGALAPRSATLELIGITVMLGLDGSKV